MRLDILAGLILLFSGCTGTTVPVYEDTLNHPSKWEEKLTKHIGTSTGSHNPVSTETSRENSKRNLSESPLRLSSLFKAIELRNPKIKAARKKWQAARENAVVQSRMPDPKTTFMIADEPVQTRNGPVDWKAKLTQKFPWFGKLDAREQAQLAKAGKAAAHYRKTKLQIRTKMIRAYFNYFLYKKSIQKLEEIRELVHRLKQQIRSKYENGQVPRQDVLKTEIEHSNLQRRSSDLEDLLTEEKRRINSLIDRPDQASLGHPEPESREGTLPEKQTLVEKAKKYRPALSKARFNTMKHRHHIEQARLNFYPDFKAGIKYYGVGETSLPGAVESGQDGLEFIVGMEIPLWQKPRKARLRKNRNNLRSAILKLRDLENQTDVEITGQLAAIRSDRRKIDYLENTALPKAHDALDSSETAYETGDVDIMNLLDSEQSLLRYELDRFRAISSYRTALAELEQIVGTSISLQ